MGGLWGEYRDGKHQRRLRAPSVQHVLADQQPSAVRELRLLARGPLAHVELGRRLIDLPRCVKTH